MKDDKPLNKEMKPVVKLSLISVTHYVVSHVKTEQAYCYLT